MTNFEIGAIGLIVALVAAILLMAIYIVEYRKVEEYLSETSTSPPKASNKIRFADKTALYNANFERVLQKTTEDIKLYELSLQSALRRNGDAFKIIGLAEVLKLLIDSAVEKKLISQARIDSTAFNEQEVIYTMFAISLVAATTRVDSRASMRLNAYVKSKRNTPYSLAIIQRLFSLMIISLYERVMATDLPNVQSNKSLFDRLITQSYNNVNRIPFE